MTEFDREFITGAAAVVILHLLREREMYGYEIVQEAGRRSARVFQLKEGTGYPALHEMARAGLVKARWQASDAGRPRKDYSLTAAVPARADSYGRPWTAHSPA